MIKKTLGSIFLAGGLLFASFFFPVFVEVKDYLPIPSCAADGEQPGINRKTLATVADCRLENDKVIFDFALANHSSAAKKLQFNSGQQFELIIKNEKNEEVYRYSEGKFFTQAIIYKTIEPGGSLHWQAQWDMRNKEGKAVSAGRYRAEIKIMATEGKGVKKTEKSQFKTVVEFWLTDNEPCYESENS